MAQGQFLTRLFSVFGNSSSTVEPDSNDPREHHYYFAHHYLPAKANENAEALVEKLRIDPATQYLTSLWESSRSEIQPDDDDVVISTQGLASFQVDLDTRHSGVVVQFPSPTRTLEAYFAALILDRTSSLLNGHRYFTLELADDSEGCERTVFCEWTDKRHINYGDGPRPEREAFIGHVARFLSNQNE